MLFYYYDVVCIISLFIILGIWLIAGYTYQVNKKRDEDDPRKQDYDPLTILIAPFTAPFFLALAVLFFIALALLFAGFLILFSALLLAIRKPFLFKLWDKFATWIGDPLLKANSYLIKRAFRPWDPNPQSP